MIKTGLALSLFLLTTVAESSESLSDPTRPLVDTDTTISAGNKPSQQVRVPPKNLLRGIIVQANGRRAIIDSSLVAEGERINGYLVKRIEADKVILKRGEATKTLRLSPQVKVINNKG